MSEKLIAYLFPFLKFDKLLLCNFQRTFESVFGVLSKLNSQLF